MEFKLSKRDKLLLTVIGTLLIVVVSYVYFITPALAEKEELVAELEQAQAEQNEIQLLLANLALDKLTYEELIAHYNEENAEIYGVMTGQDMDKLVTGALLECGLTISRLTISGGNTPADVLPLGEDRAEGTAGKLLFYSVSVEANGTYQQVWNTIDHFANNSPSIRVTDYSIERTTGLPVGEDAASSDVYKLRLGIDVYMCEKLGETDGE